MAQAQSKDLLSFKMQLMICSVCASQQLCPLMDLPHLIWDGVVGKAVGEQWFCSML